MDAETIAHGSRDTDHAHALSGSSVNQIRIVGEKSKWLLVIVGVNLAVSIFLFAEWRIAERESRLLQYYLLELDAKFIAAGLKKPEDSIAHHLKEK